MMVFPHLRHAIDLASNPPPEQQADIVEMERAIADWFRQYERGKQYGEAETDCQT
jgi:hypothetical protein